MAADAVSPAWSVGPGLRFPSPFVYQVVFTAPFTGEPARGPLWSLPAPCPTGLYLGGEGGRARTVNRVHIHT